jgi:hypothetical protein
MTVIDGETFLKSTVEIDGKFFKNCKLLQSTLVYRGGDLPSFVGCEIGNCTFKFEDSALRTLRFLNSMYGGGMKDVVDDFIKAIKQPSGPPTSLH